ncbi:glycerate kinase type-2 family protein [Halonotius pteroides]|uniref:Glycerate kinase n=1 Tax=Halonotius pteroides TaxID=268735 RepID=A0A3A6Q9W8_9EURY|nr:glycerate kinase [Halonotius pteroides]
MIRNRDQLPSSPAHEVALDCLAAGIKAADPARLTRRAVSLADGALTVDDLADYGAVIVLGGGKAAAVVAAELEAILGDALDGGLVITDSPDASPVSTQRVEVLAGDHPIPSERGVESTRRLLEAAEAADESTLILGVITGGGSALMTAPAEELSLADLQATTDALLASGATIDEINAVRKHCSAIKGGRLAAAAQPADIRSLVVSDVVGNDLATVASGPLVGDPTTYADARAVLDRYDCDVPAAVIDHLDRGIAGEIDETPTPGDPVFTSVTTTIISDGRTAVEAAADRATEAGFDPVVLSSQIRGEAREAAKTQVAIAEEIQASGRPIAPPAVVVSGGETTVTVDGDGTGGPNQEFALSAAVELAAAAADDSGVGDAVGDTVVAAVDTDGIDGPTDAAGGIVDSETITPGVGRRALAENDATAVLDSADALIDTGPTGTNVNDLRVVVVDAS